MFETLAASLVTRAIGLALVHFLWQGTVIAAAIAVLFRWLRHAPANVRYVIGCAALFTMAALPVATAMRAFDVHGHTGAARAAAIGTPADAVPPSVMDSRTAASGSSDAAALAPGLGTPVLLLVVMVWAAGVVVLTLNLGGGWLRSLTLKRHSAPVGQPWHDQVQRAAERLGIVRRVVLSQSEGVDVPTLVGWIRPAIVVPASVLAGLTPAQLDAILTHELAHVRRHDYLVNLLQSAVETVLFYHPAVWWLSTRVRLERELCCDDLVVGVCADRVEYARALASLEELRSRRPVLGVAATGGNLLYRVQRILSPAPVREFGSSAGSLIVTTGAIASIVLFLTGIERGAAAEPRLRAADVELTPSSPAQISRSELAPPSTFAAPVVRPSRQSAGGSANQSAVLAVEEQFRLAKVEGDLAALERLLDNAFVETNQNGNTRNKEQTIDLWRTFRIDLLTLDSATVEMAGDLARVTGRQTEINPTGTDRMLYTRLWRRVGDSWKLFSVTQFRDPNAPRTASRAGASQVPPTVIPMRYEIFRNDTLLGRPTATQLSGRPWTMEVPGMGTLAVTVAPAGSGGVTGTVQSETVPATTFSLKGTEPFDVGWTSNGDRYRLRIQTPRVSVPAGSPIPPAGNGGAVRLGGDIRRPEILKKVDPIYPQAAKDANVSGMVIIEIVLDETGRVEDAKIIRSVPMLDAAALDAVRQWQYTPTSLAGKPVKVMMSVNVTFARQ